MKSLRRAIYLFIVNIVSLGFVFLVLDLGKALYFYHEFWTVLAIMAVIACFTDVIMHFFMIRKYAVNRVVVLFIILFLGFLLLLKVVFPIEFTPIKNSVVAYNFYTSVMLWSLFSSIISNIMYYAK